MIFRFKKRVKRAVAFMRSGFRADLQGIRILMYHSIGGRPSDHRLAIRVPLANFSDQLDELAYRGYITATVAETFASGPVPESPRRIVITFDDGYKDNIALAADMLAKRGMKATFFITCSNIDGKSNKRWMDDSPRQYMDWTDVIKLGKMGFEIGSHMIDHVDLSRLSGKELSGQLEISRRVISERIGIAPLSCSYPYGGVNDKVIEAAKDAGYLACCSSFKGLNSMTTGRYILRRTEIDGYDIISDFRDKLSGYYD